MYCLFRLDDFHDLPARLDSSIPGGLRGFILNPCAGHHHDRSNGNNGQGSAQGRFFQTCAGHILRRQALNQRLPADILLMIRDATPAFFPGIVERQEMVAGRTHFLQCAGYISHHCKLVADRGQKDPFVTVIIKSVKTMTAAADCTLEYRCQRIQLNPATDFSGADQPRHSAGPLATGYPVSVLETQTVKEACCTGLRPVHAGNPAGATIQYQNASGTLPLL